MVQKCSINPSDHPTLDHDASQTLPGMTARPVTTAARPMPAGRRLAERKEVNAG